MQEQIGDLLVHHPRYFLLPKISMPWHGRLMAAGCRSLLRKMQEQERFDCIDAHFVYPDGFAACLLGRMLGVPVIVSARGTDITLYPSFRTIRPMIQWTLQNAAGLIAVSESLKTAMIQLGTPAEKIRVIPNGTDAKNFYPQDRLEARHQLGLPEDAKIILSVGNLLPVKCHDRLINVVDQITDRHPKLKAYIVGEGPLRPKLEAQIEEADLQDHVFLVGGKPNQELRSWYSAANVSCLLSSREGWPNVLSESIACGTPVIATRVGGVPEIVSSSEFGRIVESDSNSIVKGLDYALNRSWNRQAMAEHASRRTWHCVAEEIQEFIESRLGR